MGIQSNPSTTDRIPDAAPVYLYSEEGQLGWYGPSHLHNPHSYRVEISPRSSGLSTCTRQNKFLQRSCSVGGTRAPYGCVALCCLIECTDCHTQRMRTEHRCCCVAWCVMVWCGLWCVVGDSVGRRVAAWWIEKGEGWSERHGHKKAKRCSFPSNALFPFLFPSLLFSPTLSFPDCLLLC